MASTDAYTRLIVFLDEHGAPYRLIDRAPEGRTELVSSMRGNTLSQAAKCIVMPARDVRREATKGVAHALPHRLERRLAITDLRGVPADHLIDAVIDGPKNQHQPSWSV